MPYRRDVFRNNEIYHLFNRTIDNKLLFNNYRKAETFIKSVIYYRSGYPLPSLSKFKILPQDLRYKLEKALSFRKYFRVEILTYCLLPTHFHFLIRQIKNDGIVRFVSDTLNSFTRYWNIKIKRKGPIFLPRFQSRRIISEEQLIHVSRYIHLNPYSHKVVKTLYDLSVYPWSSYKDYLNESKSNLVSTNTILGIFNNQREEYKNFAENQADYQRLIQDLKYIEKW